MPHKKVVKKKRKRKDTEVLAMPSQRSVSIRRASNGYVVSSYTNTGEKTYIAKTSAEAKKHIDKLLGGK